MDARYFHILLGLAVVSLFLFLFVVVLLLFCCFWHELGSETPGRNRRITVTIDLKNHTARTPMPCDEHYDEMPSKKLFIRLRKKAHWPAFFSCGQTIPEHFSTNHEKD